jgi:hypothetical protein
MKIAIPVKPLKRRAIELYHADSPFRQKRVPLKTLYKRNQKHRLMESIRDVHI